MIDVIACCQCYYYWCCCCYCCYYCLHYYSKEREREREKRVRLGWFERKERVLRNVERQSRERRDKKSGEVQTKQSQTLLN
jgi:hypothetical protein